MTAVLEMRRWLCRARHEHDDLADTVRDRHLAGAVLALLGSADPTTAASQLIGGLTASELPTGSVGGLWLEVGGPQGFRPVRPVLRPEDPRRAYSGMDHHRLNGAHSPSTQEVSR